MFKKTAQLVRDGFPYGDQWIVILTILIYDNDSVMVKMWVGDWGGGSYSQHILWVWPLVIDHSNTIIIICRYFDHNNDHYDLRLWFHVVDFLLEVVWFVNNWGELIPRHRRSPLRFENIFNSVKFPKRGELMDNGPIRILNIK